MMRGKTISVGFNGAWRGGDPRRRAAALRDGEAPTVEFGTAAGRGLIARRLADCLLGVGLQELLRGGRAGGGTARQQDRDQDALHVRFLLSMNMEPESRPGSLSGA